MWWHTALGYKCKASWLQRGTVNKNKNSLRVSGNSTVAGRTRAQLQRAQSSPQHWVSYMWRVVPALETEDQKFKVTLGYIVSGQLG